MVMGMITVEHLQTKLLAAGHTAAQAIEEAMLAGSTELGAYPATASVLSKTLDSKYSLALQRGVDVEGLEDVVRTLREFEDAKVMALTLDAGPSSFVIVPDHEMDLVLGVLQVSIQL